jgi:RNA polymerase sigma-70 factor (ECF subfamily)
LLQGARAGHSRERDEFVRIYSSPIRGFLAGRWRGGPLLEHVEDAVQDVFLEFLKPGGVLDKVDATAPGGFRALLAAVVRNVAARHEKRDQQQRGRGAAEAPPLDDLLQIQTSLSQALDREWARALAREAAAEQERRARERGGAALVRVEILRLRFHEGLPIREIAERLELEPDYVHHQFAKARRDYREALLTVLRGRFPKATAEELDAQCTQLMELLR